jgi:hypothetical protein
MVQNLVNENDSEIKQLLNQMNIQQLRYVIALLDHPKRKDAALEVGIDPGTAYNWGKPPVRLAELIIQQKVLAGQEIFERAYLKAVQEKINGLYSDSETVRQKAATEIIDRVSGRPIQRTDVTTGGEQLTKTYISVSPDDWDDTDDE